MAALTAVNVGLIPPALDFPPKRWDEIFENLNIYPTQQMLNELNDFHFREWIKTDVWLKWWRDWGTNKYLVNFLGTRIVGALKSLGLLNYCGCLLKTQ